MIIVDISITTLSVTKVFVEIMNVRRDILKPAVMENSVSLEFGIHVPISMKFVTNRKTKKLPTSASTSTST